MLWENQIPAGKDDVGGTNTSRQVEVHRTKGRLVFDDGQVKMVQGVREIFDIIDSNEANEGLSCKIVLIGRHLENGMVERSLLSALNG